MNRAIIYTDGAARGNPGPAAIGAVIKDERNCVVTSISQRIGVTTNNQAEYRALIAALQKVTGLGVRHVEIRSDSELMVKQLNGEYHVRNAGLKPLYAQVREALSSFESFIVVSIPREQNRAADSLANLAFDSH